MDFFAVLRLIIIIIIISIIHIIHFLIDPFSCVTLFLKKCACQIVDNADNGIMPFKSFGCFRPEPPLSTLSILGVPLSIFRLCDSVYQSLHLSKYGLTVTSLLLDSSLINLSTCLVSRS